jgi:hypothetical protein
MRIREQAAETTRLSLNKNGYKGGDKKRDDSPDKRKPIPLIASRSLVVGQENLKIVGIWGLLETHEGDECWRRSELGGRILSRANVRSQGPPSFGF